MFRRNVLVWAVINYFSFCIFQHEFGIVIIDLLKISKYFLSRLLQIIKVNFSFKKFKMNYFYIIVFD